MSRMRISLDTNVFIFGFRKIDPYAVLILQNLFRFDVLICDQIERELRNNFSESELKQVYDQIKLLSNFHIIYQIPDEELLAEYQRFGLKLGDAKIAAFCDQEEIDVFVTENRHFLQNIKNRSFKITDCQSFCEMFYLT